MAGRMVNLSVWLLLCFGLIWSGAARSEALIGVPLVGQVQVTAGHLKLNKASGLYESKLKLKNVAKPKQAVYGPFTLVVDVSKRPGVTLANASGQTDDGKPFFRVPGSEMGLQPREKLKGIVLQFSSPSRKKPKLRYSVYGLLTPNGAPVAEAGPDRTATVGVAVDLDGSASSDPDGHALAYRWSFVERPVGSNAVLADAEGAKPGFTADMAGTYRVRLVVSDGIVESVDEVEVMAQAGTPIEVNHKPVAGSITATATENTPATILLVGSDEDGDPLSYAKVTDPSHGTLTITGDTATYTPRGQISGFSPVLFWVKLMVE